MRTTTSLTAYSKRPEMKTGQMSRASLLTGTAAWVVGVGTIAGDVIQVVDLNSQILGGHHNSIVLESGQDAVVNGISSEGFIQGSYIDNLIDGGHHNLIIVDSTQVALVEG